MKTKKEIVNRIREIQTKGFEYECFDSFKEMRAYLKALVWVVEWKWLRKEEKKLYELSWLELLKKFLKKIVQVTFIAQNVIGEIQTTGKKMKTKKQIIDRINHIQNEGEEFGSFKEMYAYLKALVWVLEWKWIKKDEKKLYELSWLELLKKFLKWITN